MKHVVGELVDEKPKRASYPTGHTALLQQYTAGDATSVATRWEVAAHTQHPRFGAFLPMSLVSGFDCEAAGIRKGEAMTMDPQQRLLLEVRESKRHNCI